MKQRGITPWLRSLGWRPALLAAALGLALVVPAAYKAGYPAGSQAVFVALAGIAFFAAIFADEDATFASLRSGPALALGGLGLLSGISAAWTLIGRVDSFRWGLVVIAYGGLTVAGAVFARRPRGVLVIAASVAVLAAGEAAVGLTAAALHQLPYAERIGGSWRAGGTFEYSSALALLEVMALPVLIAAMLRARTIVAAAAAAAIGLAAGAIVISESRIEVAMAMVVCVAALLLPARTVRRSRRETVAAILLLTLAGAAVRAAVGGYVPPHQMGGSARRLFEVAAIAIACGVIWAPLHALARRLRWPFSYRPPPAALVLVALVLAALAFVITTAPLHGRGIAPSAGFLHGRSGQWHAAWRAFLDRPVLGAGADGYLAASAVYQGRAPVRYAHDLPLESAAELGVAGIVVVVLLYVTVGALLWRSRHDRRVWLVRPGVAAFMIANLVDWEWHLPLSSAVWALQLGAVIALSPSPSPSKSPSQAPVPARRRPPARVRAAQR
jgi:hypothetical protein